jgi:hypothetical protein
MNRLKSLPWTQILLSLILVATVANYIELCRIERAVERVRLAVSLLPYLR